MQSWMRGKGEHEREKERDKREKREREVKAGEGQTDGCGEGSRDDRTAFLQVAIPPSDLAVEASSEDGQTVAAAKTGPDRPRVQCHPDIKTNRYCETGQKPETEDAGARDLEGRAER